MKSNSIYKDTLRKLTLLFTKCLLECYRRVWFMREHVANALTWGGSMRFPARKSWTLLIASKTFFWWPNLTMPISSKSSQASVVTFSTEWYPCLWSGITYSSNLSNRSHSSNEPYVTKIEHWGMRNENKSKVWKSILQNTTGTYRNIIWKAVINV